MAFNTVDVVLQAGATEAERVNVLASEGQFTATGIIDGPAGTDVNAAYFERDNGIIDAIIGLYDILAGRDVSGTLDLIGGAAFDGSGNLALDGSLTVANDVAIAGDITNVGAITGVDGSIELTGLGQIRAGRFQIKGEIATAGIYFEELEHAPTLGQINRTMYYSGNDFVSRLPNTEAEYTTLGNGGRFIYHNQGKGFGYLNQRGHWALGGKANSALTPAGIHIQKRDLWGSNGETSITAETLTADDRDTSVFKFKEINYHSTLATITLEMDLSVNRLGDNEVIWKEDGVEIAKLNKKYTTLRNFESEYITATNGLDVEGNNGINVNGASAGINVTGTGGVSTTFLVVNDSCSIEDLIVENSFWSGITNSRFGASGGGSRNVEIVSNSANEDHYLKAFTSSNNVSFGFSNSGTLNQPYLATDASVMHLVGGTPGTISKEFVLQFDGHSSGVGALAFLHDGETEAKGFFVDQAGVPKVADIASYPTGLGPITTGLFNVPRATTAVDITDQATLNTACDSVSARGNRAMVLVNGTVGGYAWAYSSGAGDWTLL
jgi:hypothetical protein